MTRKQILEVADFVLEDQREYLLPQSVDHPDCELCQFNWHNIVHDTMVKAVKKFSK